MAVFSPAASHAQDNPLGGKSADQCSGPLGSLIPECQRGAGVSAPEAVKNLPPGMLIPPEIVSKGAKNAAPAEPQGEPRPARPQGSTEFQRFIATSSGQMLPVFGADLFEGVPSTFAPVDRVPVTADYVIGPGDEVLLRAWGQVNLDVDLTVDRSGAVFIPQVGNVTVAGLQYEQLAGFLRAQLQRVFRNFDLSVNMGQLRSIQIFVVGQVRRPGTYTISSLSTLVNAIFASGGPSSQGSMRHIQLKRGTQLETEFDIYDLLMEGDKSKDKRLLPGDVVYVPPVGPQIALAGTVKNPAIYELKAETTVGELIRIAGGLSPVADVQHAILERVKDGTSRETQALALDAAGLNTHVRDGDLLRVLSITPRIANAVTLRGNVANPGRFPWRAGMRLRDVIPDKDSLVTRDYWKKRNLLGQPAADVAAPAPVQEQQSKPVLTSVETSVPDINWTYAVIERQNPRDLATELTAFDLGKLVLEGDEKQNLELRPGDVVTIFSQADIKVSTGQQTRFVRLEGEFNAAGIYLVRPGETLGQLIQRAGGLTPHSYLYGAEFMRESTRKDQQRRLDELVRDMQLEVEHAANTRLGAQTNAEEAAAVAARLDSQRRLIERLRAVQPTGRIVLNLEPGDSDLSKLMDLTLEDGDRFVIPARPATVNVIGAVYNPNSFVHKAGGPAGLYLRQAGGPTRNADAGRAFIIRADGSVLPRQGFNPFSKAFDATRLNPGDTIVVPEAVLHVSFLRGLRDWTQVFSQMALGAAAINILR